ncbi:MBL fold metallo-hydrolase [Parabacteroides sp. OttesenSCG-928-K15]|nr:MBL fold metallo-hydrolase [Parabacteroides sp. OttesenSCG-928-K15]
MKITLLGTGTSTGVPEIGCHCEVCCSNDPRDRRLRTSAIVETEGKRILLDCGPDFRYQMLKHKIEVLDAVLLSHEHYDHVSGLDDLRPYIYNREVPVFAEEEVVNAIRTRLPYAFRTHKYPGVPQLDLRVVGLEPFKAAGIEVIPIRVMHGGLPILGFRIGNFAYLTDLKSLPEEEFSKLEGLDVLLIDALLVHSRHFSHAGVAENLPLIHRLQPKQTYFIHMSHRIGLHAKANSGLPPHIHFGFDGLEIEL